MFNPNAFSGKKILITGAAVGIGKATAELLASLGASIILVDINEEVLHTTSSSLANGPHYTIPFNMAETAKIEEMVKTIISQSGPIDGIVHCVGIRSRRPLSLLSSGILTDVMNINFNSFIELVRCFTKKNHFNEGLSIVGVSSIAAQRGGAGVTAYAASKAAMDAAVRCLAKELAPKKIRLNTVVPAQINTPAYAELIKMSGSDEDPTLSRQYLGLGEATDVAGAITFLLSQQSRLISGTALPVDGGFLNA